MGVFKYNAPHCVVNIIDSMTTNELYDLVSTFSVDISDAPESDQHEWLRQKLYDFFYRTT